jgi:hypothetical protein
LVRRWRHGKSIQYSAPDTSNTPAPARNTTTKTWSILELVVESSSLEEKALILYNNTNSGYNREEEKDDQKGKGKTLKIFLI